MRFLIVKTSALGDIIQSFFALEYLSKKFPNASIDWIVEEEIVPLLHAHPKIDRVISLPKSRWQWPRFLWKLREKKYAAVFDLQGNCKSALIVVFLKTKKKIGFGKKTVKEWPNLLATNFKVNQDSSNNIRLQYLEVLQTFFGDRSTPNLAIFAPRLQKHEKIRLDRFQFSPSRKKVMVAFGSKWSNKQIGLDFLKDLLASLTEDHFVELYFIWGSEKEKMIAHELQQHLRGSSVLPYLNFPLWKAVMQEMDAFIGVDSAALHLAGVSDLPTFSFFGPTKAEIFKPIGEKHFHHQGSCPYSIHFQKQCPKLRDCPTGACLKDISLDSMNQRFMDWWSRFVR